MNLLTKRWNSFKGARQARVGVGIGEAGCSPPAHSLISDYFHKEERATALGLYSLGIPLGSLFGILLGGWLVSTLGWRWTFVAVGLPGILLGILVKLSLREPKRGAAEADTPLQDGTYDVPEELDERVSLPDTLKIIWSIRSFRSLIYGSAIVSFAAFGFNFGWSISLFAPMNYPTRSLQYLWH